MQQVLEWWWWSLHTHFLTSTVFWSYLFYAIVILLCVCLWKMNTSSDILKNCNILALVEFFIRNWRATKHSQQVQHSKTVKWLLSDWGEKCILKDCNIASWLNSSSEIEEFLSILIDCNTASLSNGFSAIEELHPQQLQHSKLVKWFLGDWRASKHPQRLQHSN